MPAAFRLLLREESQETLTKTGPIPVASRQGVRSQCCHLGKPTRRPICPPRSPYRARLSSGHCWRAGVNSNLRQSAHHTSAASSGSTGAIRHLQGRSLGDQREDSPELFSNLGIDPLAKKLKVVKSTRDAVMTDGLFGSLIFGGLLDRRKPSVRRTGLNRFASNWSLAFHPSATGLCPSVPIRLDATSVKLAPDAHGGRI